MRHFHNRTRRQQDCKSLERAGCGMKAVGIQELLKSRAGAEGLEDVNQQGPSCDVVFALFLEPSAVSDPRWTAFERVIDTAVRTCQPAPALLHCELLMPPVPSDESLRTQFSTYIGRKSGWQTDKMDAASYYLAENAGRWRAVPIFQGGAAQKLRQECDSEIGVSYSLLRYATAVPPLRWMSSLVSDTRRAPAHCATLAARVLRNADVYVPVHRSAWYGPTTLYHELQHQASWQGDRIGAASWGGMDSDTSVAVEQLVRGIMSPDVVHDIGDAKCLKVVEALTMRACNALLKGDAVSQRTTQQQLATALLRWTILRDLDSER